MEGVKYVTGNLNKLKEVRAILGFDIEHVALDLDEIQSLSVEEIVEAKAKAAFAECGSPVLVEDSSFGFDAWGGLPGPFIKFYIDQVGTEGLLKMLEGEENRKAVSTCCLAFYDGEVFEVVRSDVEGIVLKEAIDGPYGHGFDCIFQPLGCEGSYATMPDKNERSERFLSWNRMKELLKK